MNGGNSGPVPHVSYPASPPRAKHILARPLAALAWGFGLRRTGTGSALPCAGGGRTSQHTALFVSFAARPGATSRRCEPILKRRGGKLAKLRRVGRGRSRPSGCHPQAGFSDAEWSPRIPLARHFCCPQARPPREPLPGEASTPSPGLHLYPIPLQVVITSYAHRDRNRA